MQSYTEKALRGMSIQTLVTIIMGVLEVIVFATMSRLLTKTDFGYMATIMAIISVFSSISEAGLGSSIIQKKDDSERHVSTAFSLSILIGSLFSILLFFLSPWLANLIADYHIARPLRIISILLLLNSMQSVGNSLLTRQMRFKRLGIINIINYILSSTIGVILAYRGFGVYSIVYSQILYAFLQILFVYAFCVKIPKFAIYKRETKEVLSFGGWLSMSVVLNNLNSQIDKFVMPRLLGVNALGAYNRPSGFITTISNKFNSIFDSVLFPILSKLQSDFKRLRSVYLRSLSLLNLFSVILSSTLFFNAKLIIVIFFGVQWIDLVPVVRILSLVVLLSADNRLVDCFFRSLGLVRLQFFLRVGSLVLSTLFIVGGAYYGILGVATGYVLSQVCIILTKICILNHKMLCPVSDLIKTISRSWIVMLPIVVLSIIFFAILGESLVMSFIFAIFFAVSLLIMLLCFPQWVGGEYYEFIYPQMKRFVHRKVRLKI